jgi:phenylacetate-coenzyme A ligase PaaK-like adenylate-forming protein
MRLTKFKINILRLQPIEKKRVSLPFPTDPKVRIAQLTETPPFEGVEAFIPERWLELERYRPHVILGNTADLQRLAEQVDLGMVDLTCVNHAVVALTACGASPLSDVLRVVLWQSLGVPIFELYIGPDHRLLAYECEAHDGWHLESGVVISTFGGELMDAELSDGELILDSPGTYGLRTGLCGRITEEACPCGRETPRLMDIVACGKPGVSRSLRASA